MTTEKIDPLAAMESTADGVATLTGIKQQFVDAGWAPDHAELMVIEWYRLIVAQEAGSRG